MSLIFWGRSKVAESAKNYSHRNVFIHDPAEEIEQVNDNDTIIYCRNLNYFDLKSLLKIRKLKRKKIKLVFLDTELNKKKLFNLNITLLIKKIEFFVLSRFIVECKRLYLPIILGNGMNWSRSLSHMSDKNISLKSFKDGYVQTIEIAKLIECIEKYSEAIKYRKVMVSDLCKMYHLELEIVEESLYNKIISLVKYNLVTSIIILIKNTVFRKKNKYSNIPMSIDLIGYYSLIIND